MKIRWAGGVKSPYHPIDGAGSAELARIIDIQHGGSILVRIPVYTQ